MVPVGLSTKKLQANKEIGALLLACLHLSRTPSLSSGYLIFEAVDYSVLSCFFCVDFQFSFFS